MKLCTLYSAACRHTSTTQLGGDTENNTQYGTQHTIFLAHINLTQIILSVFYILTYLNTIYLTNLYYICTLLVISL
jgi:hypothetical protein